MTSTTTGFGVFTAINQVQAALAKTGIQKNQQNQQQRYNFRGIDDIYNALGPKLAEFGVCIMPTVLDRQVVEVATQRGGRMNHVTLKVKLDFISSEDGSCKSIEVYGESMDSGDKATNKAMSAAYKTACFQVFCIPTESQDNDADFQTHEIVQNQPQQQNQNQNQSQAGGHNREEYLANRRNQQVQQQQQNGHVTETPENAYRKREKQQQQQQQQPQNAKQQYFKGVADDVKARKEAELAEQQQVMVGAHDYYESKRNGRYGNKQSGQAVVNQRAIETPDSFEAPRQPVITPQQFKRLQGALQMAHLDEVQFCTIAGNIRTLGELTQDRFDGAMARVQKEAQRMAH